jgi:CBS domain-containing protein
MICPACGYENLPGQDRCATCESSLMQEDVPQPDTPSRWRIMVDPISSLEPSTVEPQIVPAGTSLAEGVRRMQEKNIGYLLVTDGGGKLIGILTEHDLLLQVAAEVTDLGAYTVDQVMTTDPTAVKSSEPIKHALHFMAMDDFMYVPLVDEEGRPEDLLSFRRVARLIEQME